MGSEAVACTRETGGVTLPVSCLARNPPPGLAKRYPCMQVALNCSRQGPCDPLSNIHDSLTFLSSGNPGFPTRMVYLKHNISRVSDQNGVSLLCIMLEIHHSGREPSNYSRDTPFWLGTLEMVACAKKKKKKKKKTKKDKKRERVLLPQSVGQATRFVHCCRQGSR